MNWFHPYSTWEGDSDTVHNHGDVSKSSSDVYGGGGLVRQKSIYPGQGNGDYSRGDSNNASATNMMNGIPVERQDSDTFSWSSLFSMSSVDGYGLNNNVNNNINGNSSSSTDRDRDRDRDRSARGFGSTASLNDRVKTAIKDENSREDKNMKRGIAELGSLVDGSNYNMMERNIDSQDSSNRRQRVTTTYPPLNPNPSTTQSAPLNSAHSNNNNSMGMGSGLGTMDPPSLEKAQSTDNFYGSLRQSEVRQSVLKMSIFYVFIPLCKLITTFYFVLTFCINCVCTV